MDKCGDEACECYPWYGLAPHSHDLSKTGSFLGSTVIEEDKSKWPSNFLEDQDEPGMGTYFCPGCLKGLADEKA